MGLRTVAPLNRPPDAALAGPGDTIEQSLYEVRRRIHPRAVHGWFAAWRVALVIATQAVFYGLPWLAWNGRQAVLFDLARRKFHIFGLVLWPQDIVYLTAILVIAALSLFLFTAVAGRLFCGHVCPQTVYTEIFMAVERFFEGDRQARIRLDALPAASPALARRWAKHVCWMLIALWTGITFVGYVVPIRTLVPDVLALQVDGWRLFWIAFYALATYGNAGFMREQVCKYMCPYARFQSSMFDHDTLIITYDSARGDPRGSRPRKADPGALGLGDCIDCGICVEVCPTGIDIRNGLQYECIGCAACIDGCNQIMSRMGYAPGLVRYSTQRALANASAAKGLAAHLLRPRVLVYASLILALTAVLVTSLTLRVPLRVDVLRDRVALGRILEDGSVENVYRLQIMNTAEAMHRFRIDIDGPKGAVIVSPDDVAIAGASMGTVVTAVRVPPQAGPGSWPIRFHVHALDQPTVQVVERSIFRVPQ